MEQLPEWSKQLVTEFDDAYEKVFEWRKKFDEFLWMMSGTDIHHPTEFRLQRRDTPPHVIRGRVYPFKLGGKYTGDFIVDSLNVIVGPHFKFNIDDIYDLEIDTLGNWIYIRVHELTMLSKEELDNIDEINYLWEEREDWS